MLLDRTRDAWRMTQAAFRRMVEPSKYDELENVLD